MRKIIGSMIGVLFLAGNAPPDDAAHFGARASVEHISLSPDGSKVAVIAPTTGQGSIAYVMDIKTATAQRPFLMASGQPERLTRCKWVSNSRLVCSVFFVDRQPDRVVGATRMVAIDENGNNLKILSTRQNFHSHSFAWYGGSVIDWLPEQDGKVLMVRNYVPDTHLGSRIGSSQDGLGVDQVDTNTLAIKRIEAVDENASEFISDGRGAVRIKGSRKIKGSTGQASQITTYYYRSRNVRDWQRLAEYDDITGAGFNPLAVDHERDIAYGLKKKDGRFALYSIALDGSMKEELVFAHPHVDVDGLEQIGRRNRVVGVSYVTDYRQSEYFDPGIKKLAVSLHNALPGHPNISVVDSSVDENKLLVLANSDTDPGVYYILDRTTREMKTFLVSRPQLEGRKLATVSSIQYSAADGTMIPAYITYPPGKENGKMLPTLIMPHGGPSARDEWGFDWLAQYFAARGYVVLQPQFRGSAGFGDAWFRDQGFKSWRVAIGDVLDAGRWMIRQGIADSSRLAIVGWSYGGYAALQSAVTDPALFKAVIAIAPVTDLNLLRSDAWGWSDYSLRSEFIGNGVQAREGSPAQNAGQIKAPVLLFHGDSDRNVSVQSSQLMGARLKDARVPYELVIFKGLDHGLADSTARAEMLRKSDDFLRSALK